MPVSKGVSSFFLLGWRHKQGLIAYETCDDGEVKALKCLKCKIIFFTVEVKCVFVLQLGVGIDILKYVMRNNFVNRFKSKRSSWNEDWCIYGSLFLGF